MKTPLTTDVGAQLFERWRLRGEGWCPLLSEPLLALAFDHLGPVVTRGSTVLDLGSGSGHVGRLFASVGAAAIALDIHRPSVSASHACHPNLLALVARAEQMPLRAGSVDAIFCWSVLQYAERSAALAECHRLLRPGGRFVVIENLRGNPFARLYRRWRRVTGGYESHLTPREHIEWRDRGIYQQFFGRVEYTAFHVVAPALTLLPAVHGRSNRRVGSVTRALVSAINGADAVVLRRVPRGTSMAWTLVVRGERLPD
jgi:SAM-dependent methyltransferase